jgi:thiamine pyrophosphate-dependent acetolactate synthase large subunit-like protein
MNYPRLVFAAVAVRGLIAKTTMPVVCTYQGAGVVPREHFPRFGGRVGFPGQGTGKTLAKCCSVRLASSLCIKAPCLQCRSI